MSAALKQTRGGSSHVKPCYCCVLVACTDAAKCIATRNRHAFVPARIDRRHCLLAACAQPAPTASVAITNILKLSSNQNGNMPDGWMWKEVA
jgi:hypothetical protein